MNHENPFAPPTPPEERQVRVGPQLERIHSLSDVITFLNERARRRNLPERDRKALAEACNDIAGCDPWTYEPFMLDELFRERRGSNDPARINELRGLIRAGSWMTYPRIGAKDALDDIAAIKRMHAEESLSGLLAELSNAERAISKGIVGEGLERVTTSVENLCAQEWHAIKMQAATHGVTWKNAKENPNTARAATELDRLRPLRDFIYQRRLYPKWSNIGIGG